MLRTADEFIEMVNLSEIADYEWLTSEAAARWLEECAESSLSSDAMQKRLRKELSTERARLVVWQTNLRRKASEKFGDYARRMFFTDVALEQATDRWIARYKANRFVQRAAVTDFCCGIGGDLLALAERGMAEGWDRSPEIVLFARANLAAWNPEWSGRVCDGRVEDHPPAPDTSWHLDPDRRTDGRRSTKVQWHSPDGETIERWLSTSPNGAIKLAPATELPGEWQARAECEWISRARQCRQLVAWCGGLTETHGLSRATLVDGDKHKTFVGDPNQVAEITEAVGAFVFDTDPAIRAARLTGALALAVGCDALSPGEGYLTAERALTHPLLTVFRVHEVLPLRVPTIKKYIEATGVGTLEIKTRGVSTSPEIIRKAVKLRGSKSATLLLTRQGKREIAILAERVGAT